ncbi:Uncharacterised protein [uncultured archaeon]|nr:Uncharacterised protein [uncultured archaeon]
MKNYLLMGLIFVLLLGTSLGQNPDIGDLDAFKHALEQDGFTVQQGLLSFYDLLKVYNNGLLPSAYGNNPNTKYLNLLVPPPSGQEVKGIISELMKALGVTANITPFSSLRPDEAIVFVGRTPPECRYFSFDLYLMERTYGNETRWIYASLGDTLNHLVINTEGTPAGQPGNPFNQNTIVVTTADKGIDQRIRADAQSAGYSDGIINTQVIPSAMVNMGVENDSDTFNVLLRPTQFTDEQAGNNYVANTPATVFRVTPNETTELDPYDMPKLRVRGTGTTEFDLMDDLEQLRMAIFNKYSGLNATELPTSIAVPDGTDVVQRGIDGYGPTNDACYLWSVSQTASSPTPPFPDLSQYYSYLRDSAITLGNDTNEFIIVYGVNHVATGKATYENFVPYGADIWNGVGMITDLDFNGTAEEYLPDNPNAKYLYVYKIARNCEGDPHCYEVPYNAEGYGIDLDQPLFIAWRLYLENATKTGPSYTEIVYDRAIKFDPKE